MSRRGRAGGLRLALAASLAAACLATAAGVGGCVDSGGRRAVRTPPQTPTPQGPTARADVEVRLPVPAEPTLGCSGGWIAVDARGDEVAHGGSLAPATPLRVAWRSLRLGETELGSPPLEIRPLGAATLSAGGRRYRGAIRVEYAVREGRVRLVNVIPLEDYLLGVVPAEMPDRFGLEALKAQAVAARSYALAESKAQGFLWGDTRSQAYGGLDGESPLGTRAVHETAGQVLEASGEVLTAWYHSTCGGRTLPAREAFPGAAPGPLDTPVDCPDCRASPHYRWTRRFSSVRVCAATDLPEAPLDAVTTPGADLPGRPGLVRVDAGGLSATLPAETLRARLSQGRPLAEQMLSSCWRSPPVVQSGDLVVEGGGYGHGVGLCQYGAAGFAARGAAHDAILARYYPGARLRRLP